MNWIIKIKRVFIIFLCSGFLTIDYLPTHSKPENYIRITVPSSSLNMLLTKLDKKDDPKKKPEKPKKPKKQVPTRPAGGPAIQNAA